MDVTVANKPSQWHGQVLSKHDPNTLDLLAPATSTSSSSAAKRAPPKIQGIQAGGIFCEIKRWWKSLQQPKADALKAEVAALCIHLSTKFSHELEGPKPGKTKSDKSKPDSGRSLHDESTSVVSSGYVLWELLLLLLDLARLSAPVSYTHLTLPTILLV